MFLVVGKGTFLKDALIKKLEEWGVSNGNMVISKVEQTGFAQCGKHKILLVK